MAKCKHPTAEKICFIAIDTPKANLHHRIDAGSFHIETDFRPKASGKKIAAWHSILTPFLTNPPTGFRLNPCLR